MYAPARSQLLTSTASIVRPPPAVTGYRQGERRAGRYRSGRSSPLLQDAVATAVRRRQRQGGQVADRPIRAHRIPPVQSAHRRARPGRHGPPAGSATARRVRAARHRRPLASCPSRRSFLIFALWRKQMIMPRPYLCTATRQDQLAEGSLMSCVTESGHWQAADLGWLSMSGKILRSCRRLPASKSERFAAGCLPWLAWPALVRPGAGPLWWRCFGRRCGQRGLLWRGCRRRAGSQAMSRSRGRRR